MKLFTRYIKKYLGIILIFLFVFFINNLPVNAISNSRGLTPNQLNIYSKNNIMFYDPVNCVSSGGLSSFICGSTAKEKYISALNKHFDMVHVAGIMGNIANEGGFNPVMWQGNAVDRSGSWKNNRNFDYYMNTCGSCSVGVGAFQITSNLSGYLQYINSNAPDLIKYFQSPQEYGFSYYYHPAGDYETYGDILLEKIGDADFDRLVDLEINYFLENFVGSKIAAFESTTTPYDAGWHWANKIEICAACGYNEGDSELYERGEASDYYYEQIKDFSCSSGTSFYSTSLSTSGSDTSSADNASASTQDIVNKALELAWPESDSNNSTTNPTEAFIAAANESGTNPESDDRLNFVQTVIKASGADTSIPIGEYPNPDEYKTIEYMNSSSKWEKIEVNSETGLEPGDILISAVPPNSDGSHGVGKNHIFVYLGNGKVAAANQGKYFARISNLSSEWDPNSDNDVPFKYGDMNYQVFRLSSGGGCTTYEGEYPEYLQSAEPWGSMPYGPGCTYGGCSCGASSLAMLATYLTGQDIFPNDVGDLLGNSVYWKTTGIGAAALDKRVGEVYGFDAEGVTYSSLAEAEQKMRQYLDNGYLLHFSGAGSYPYSSGGHYIGIFGWTGNGDNVMVANSAFNGNAEMSLHEVVYAGAHGGGFSAIKGSNNSSRRPCNIDVCSSKNQNNSNTGNNDILQSVQEIIDLANQNGSTYIYGGNRSIGAFDSMLNNNTPINTDCTGFASLVIYKTYGATSIFSSSSIFGDSHYEEIPRSDVQPGDIFAYTSPQGHGGIVIEASNGVVTKIAETGGTEGRSGSNNNIGYSGSDSFSVKNMNSLNGHFFRWKGN